jgi:hypothetical protein
VFRIREIGNQQDKCITEQLHETALLLYFGETIDPGEESE